MNRSLKPLLATPTTDLELLVGKGAAVFIPTMIGTYAAFLIDIIIIDLVTYPILGFLLVPNLLWILAMFLLSPGFCILSIEANVLVSSRMSDIRAAQQVGGLVVMPLILVYFGSLTNFFPLNTLNMLILSAVILGSVVLLGSFTKRIFEREEILTKWRWGYQPIPRGKRTLSSHKTFLFVLLAAVAVLSSTVVVVKAEPSVQLSLRRDWG